jgi:hypothetical protein
MVKKGYDVAVDDDALKTSVSQNRVTATLCTEELFLRTQYILIALSTYQTGENVGGGMVNTTHGSVLAAVHTSQLTLHAFKQGLQST